MMSSEISDLESFIDSYVTTEKTAAVSSTQSWSRTQSSEDGFLANVQQFNEKSYSSTPQQNGTELWGQKPGGHEWHASTNAKTHEDWNDHRPKIQERQVQWQQQSNPPPLMSQTNYPPQADSSYFQQPQEPSNIQAIVTDLIRQNHMNKQNIPPWVDVSQPPPPFPGGMNQPLQQPQQLFNHQPPEPNLYYDPQDPRFSGQEPILHSMTFQRADVAMSNPQTNTIPFTQPVPQVGESWGPTNYNSTLFYQDPQQLNASQPHFYNPALPAANNLPPPLATNTQPFYNEQQNLDFHSEIMQGGHFESPNNLPPPLAQPKPSLPPPLAQAEPNIPTSLSQAKTSSNISLEKISMEALAPTNATTQSPAVDTLARTEQSPVRNKYPNSRLRNSRGSSNGDVASKDADVSNKETCQRRGSEDVFESEHNDGQKMQSQNLPSQSNKKKPVQRKSSAADEDSNWRSRNSSDSSPTKTGSRNNRSVEGEGWNMRNNANKREVFFVSSPFSRSKRICITVSNRANEATQQRHLQDKRMGNVLSWLQNEKGRPGDIVGNEIRRLQISDSEADLTRFIEMTQSFATNEAKMREVAEIICNKALKDPRFCRNASILCDRMSFMMVQGTKFRSVVLNVMQGHYKNRDQLYASSYRKDRRWFGFVTFLVEIFLNVRTASRERLLVLTNPVFNSLFQVLVGNQIDREHIDCFGLLFERVGSGLEAENLTRLNELMAEIRDRCVISKSDYVKRVLLRCVELYASKWKS